MGYDENINSNELGKCSVNFTRSQTNARNTIREASDEYFRQELKRQWNENFERNSKKLF